MTGHVYMFGFNGFQQIDSFRAETSVCLPQKYSRNCGTEDVRCVFTWSQSWVLADNSKADMLGFRTEEVANWCSKENITPMTILPQGHHTLLQTSKRDHQNLYLLCDGGTSVAVTCTPDNVKIADTMEKKVFATKASDLYGGKIEVSEVRAVLKLQSLDMKIKVTMVSCGYDHTLILSSSGEVYSCGSSSRGQLGLGESSVDIVHTPVAVNTLEGIRTVTIAAGGWHSTAVSECGDLYVWGWNESGQLGLPKRHDTSDTEGTATSASSEILNAEESSKYSALSKADQDLEKDASTKMADSKVVGNKLTYEGSIEHCSNKITGKRTSVMSSENIADEGLEPGVPLSFIQNTDPVQVQPVPYGLDIPDEMCVKDVACGSRHTCILLDSGYMMTTGWNKYGQLGHGDKSTTDYLRTVTYFVKRKETVTNIFAGYWNTGVITKPT